VSRRFDALVVGAGPAGSACAQQLATAGARVLLADKARFPRDKPCGGALTWRSVRQLPVPIDPVVEHVVDRIELRLRYRAKFERKSVEPLMVLTQRRLLDLYLAEQACAAGAEFRDGVRVEALDVHERGVSALVGGERVEAETVVDAAGANGRPARSLGLRGGEGYGVALEGNLPLECVPLGRYERRIVVEVDALPGGYGWIFPKGDHVNVGVGGWKESGPRLREHLVRLCAAHEIDPARLTDVRGARLPLRSPSAIAARGRALLVGDAAGLVDPLSGEGMFEAFVSSRLASEAVVDLLAGRARDLAPYDRALSDAIAPMASASWAAKRAVDRYPRLTFALGRVPFAWTGIVGLLRGDIDHPDSEPSLLARAPLQGIQAMGRGERVPRRRALRVVTPAGVSATAR
jgi:geranylgeranyl reductase family protein